MDMDWVKFGWQGVSMELPANWELGGLSGDYNNGYVRMDDEDMPRMELKWSKSKEKKPDLQKILDRKRKGPHETIIVVHDTNCGGLGRRRFKASVASQNHPARSGGR